jgi:hypothetical protein
MTLILGILIVFYEQPLSLWFNTKAKDMTIGDIFLLPVVWMTLYRLVSSSDRIKD